jgi:2-polyprenyl-3-methyl-5-hydroxy-6-metoxy-1,4-benzoquinol methylase
MDATAESLPDEIASPFGGLAQRIQIMPVRTLVEMYSRKCGVDVSASFGGITDVGLYRCTRTGYRFWRPERVAGDEGFYQAVSSAWANYYRTERWEYPLARKYLPREASILEIGCGPGHFLKSVEGMVPSGMGLEFNSEAIHNKVTSFPIMRCSIEQFSTHRRGEFQFICAFQVLEHVLDPFSFIQSALECLVKGGLLVMSTPNHDHGAFKSQRDAFDLPPHHIGHFDARTYDAIAAAFGIEVLDLALQTGELTWLTRARGVMQGLWHGLRPPGPNMMIVYKK